MNNNKQSSVGWYSVIRDVLEIRVRLGKLSGNEYVEELAKAEQQAKAMHKEEMIDALLFGDVLSLNTAEQYYNETFGGNK